MTYDAKHLYLAWGGNMPGGETWTSGLRLKGPAGGSFPSQAYIGTKLGSQFHTMVETYFTSLEPYTGLGTSLTWVKANAIGTNGRYADPSTNLYELPTALGGSHATPPNQNALVVTLDTGFKRGHASSGRIFLPAFSGTIDSATGLITQVVADAVGANTVTFINALNTVDSITGSELWQVCVMSNLGAGTTHPVTSIRVGRAVDTMQSRRRSVPERYETVSL